MSVLYPVDGGLASPQFLLQDPKPLSLPGAPGELCTAETTGEWACTQVGVLSPC